MKSLADALGWPYETKQMVYNPLNLCPNLFLGASVMSVDHRKSSPLTPPWPDLVIAASRRSAPVARWIKQQSGGRTRLVHLLHTQAPLEHFDLVITTPQYQLPAQPNILQNTGPLNRIPVGQLTEAAAYWEPQLKDLPRPYSALLVGGNSSSYVLDPSTATRLGREASNHVRARGGSLLVTTSPRTPTDSVDALFAAIDCPSYRYRWQPNDRANPYLAYLALADDFIVTVDSASLMVEACLTGKPVAVFEWPARSVLRFKSNGGLEPRQQSDQNASDTSSEPTSRMPWKRLFDRLVYLGLIKPRRDFDAYQRALRARGLVTRLGETTNPGSRQPLDDMERAVARIRQLVATEGMRHCA